MPENYSSCYGLSSGYEADCEATPRDFARDDIYEGDELLRAREFREIARLDAELHGYGSQIYHLELAAAIYKSIGNNHLSCQAILHDLAHAYNNLGMHDDAADCYKEASTLPK